MIMKLYYSPGACSLASHIALHEIGRPFEIERADIRAKTTASGGDFRRVNPKGAVPALMLDGGEVLTEGVAIMQYVADVAGANDLLPPTGTLARARVQEMLNYVSSEVHKTYSPLFRGLDGDAKVAQLAALDAKLSWIETMLSDGRSYLTGDTFSPADGYLFTVTNWSGSLGHDLAAFPNLISLRARVAARPAVQAAMKAEGLLK
jgi:glutathione S-transferase